MSTTINSTAYERQFEEHRAEINYETLCEHPSAQAERVANHYAYMAQTAVTLRKIIEMSKHVPKGTALDQAEEAAQHLFDQLKDAHFKDLGIKLEWPVKPAYTP